MYKSNYPPSSSKWLVELFNLGMATDLREGKLWIQTNCNPGEECAAPGYSCPSHDTTKPA